jgi:hypothetical protein
MIAKGVAVDQCTRKVSLPNPTYFHDARGGAHVSQLSADARGSWETFRLATTLDAQHLLPLATSTPTPTSHPRPGAIHAPWTYRDTQAQLAIARSAAPGASIITANMASKVTIDASATTKPKPSIAPPIEPLNNDAARLYTHVHPVVILSLYAYKFKAIVADPVPALLGILAPLAILQIAYVAVCLPPTGETPKVKKSKPGEKKKNTPGVLETGVNGKIVVCRNLCVLWG